MIITILQLIAAFILVAVIAFGIRFLWLWALDMNEEIEFARQLEEIEKRKEFLREHHD